MIKHCAKCKLPLERETAWISDDLSDRNEYCRDCAPDDAIREKDLMYPRGK